MFYQLLQYSPERKKKFPLAKDFVLVFSKEETNLLPILKRLKKSDPKIKEVTQITEKLPSFKSDMCHLAPSDQSDLEEFYKTAK